jgi:hypothetical protein
MRLALVLSLAIASQAWAFNREAMSNALRAAKEARERSEDFRGCRSRLDEPLDGLVDSIRRLKDDPSGEGIRKARRKVGQVRDALEDCPGRVARQVDKLMDRVTENLKAIRDDDDDSDGDDNGRRHHRRDGDEDGDRGDRGDDRPPPPPEMRDCGTGPDDPGCQVSRGGARAMDGAAFGGMMQGLQANPNEIIRKDMAKRMIGANLLTARQLGMVMDLFMNEILRMEVAKFAIPRVIDREHAYGLSAKFQNTIMAGEFTEALSR